MVARFDFITEVKAYYWMVWGVEIGNVKSSFENCHYVDKEMTEKELIQSIQSAYMESGWIVTEARLDSVKTIKINMMTNEVVETSEIDV